MIRNFIELYEKEKLVFKARELRLITPSINFIVHQTLNEVPIQNLSSQACGTKIAIIHPKKTISNKANLHLSSLVIPTVTPAKKTQN